MKTVFLVGVPRSGTTWLQLLLYQHPLVASSQETHLFDWYIGKLYQAWQREHAREIPRKVGLRSLLGEKEFTEHVARFARGIVGAIAATNPQAAVILEKTPGHLAYWSLIHGLFPEARFIHLIRDPRAVVASLKRAAEAWGGDWAPKSAAGGARLWADAMAQRVVMRDALAGLYREVRYEDLRSDPVHQFLTLSRWLGLDVDIAAARTAVAACEAGKLRDKEAKGRLPWERGVEPEGFYREAPPDSWRKELRKREIRLVEYINREAMAGLGYLCEYPVLGGKPLELRARDMASRSVGYLARVIKRRAPWLLETAERALRE
jgi:hypothetical protein